MFDTVFFDLDGTLLQMNQNDFIEAYIAELSKNLAGMGLEPGAAIAAVWAGTKAMVLNDGAARNSERFWGQFCERLGLSPDSAKMAEVKASTDHFYKNEFDRAGRVANFNPLSARIVKTLREKGYGVALATNPLFPPDAVLTRLGWAGLSAADFDYITNYENSNYCKPNPAYFTELLEKLGLMPERVLMVGNNVAEDMVAASLGCAVYLVTDYIENEKNLDFSAFPGGTLADFYSYAESLPALRQ